MTRPAGTLYAAPTSRAGRVRRVRRWLGAVTVLLTDTAAAAYAAAAGIDWAWTR